LTRRYALAKDARGLAGVFRDPAFTRLGRMAGAGGVRTRRTEGRHVTRVTPETRSS
jgi:hypothetical protein